MPAGNRMQSIKWCHFQQRNLEWPANSTPLLKGMPLFDVEYLRNDTSCSSNEIFIRSYTRATEWRNCQWPWVTLTTLLMRHSIPQPVCYSWASCYFCVHCYSAKRFCRLNPTYYANCFLVHFLLIFSLVLCGRLSWLQSVFRRMLIVCRIVMSRD